MAEPYVKTDHGYFLDLCQETQRGVSIFGQPYSSSTDIVRNFMKWNNSLNGEKNPSWLYNTKHNIDATTFMTAVKGNVDARICSASVITQAITSAPNFTGNWAEYRWDGYPNYGSPLSINPPSASVLSSARNLAIRKFLQNVNDIRTSVEGGQLLGEWKETVGAITNPLGALRKFTVRHVLNAKKRIRRIQNSHGGRSRNRRGSKAAQSRNKAVAEALSNTYLEFVFGWIPLVKDVNAAVIGLLDRYDQPDRTIIKGHQRVGYDGTNTEVQLFNNGSATAYQSLLTISEVDYRFRASVKTGAVNGVRSVSRTLGLLPERFLPTVWELIPYSFVVDYFVNIGDIIASYAFQRQNIEWGSRIVRIKTEKTFGDVQMRLSPSFNPATTRLLQMGATGGGATVGAYSVDRVPIWVDSLMPDLAIHLPYSQKAWYNIGAILTQKFCSV